MRWYMVYLYGWETSTKICTRILIAVNFNRKKRVSLKQIALFKQDMFKSGQVEVGILQRFSAWCLCYLLQILMIRTICSV